MNASGDNAAHDLGAECTLLPPSGEHATVATPIERSVTLRPRLEADDNSIHFEMTHPSGDSMMWLTFRRGITPQRAVASLREIADLIERHGAELAHKLQSQEAAVRLDYDKDGNIIIVA